MRKKTVAALEKKASAVRKITYKGYTVVQSNRNHHVMIGKDGKMVYHAAVDHRATVQELRQMVDDYLELVERLGGRRMKPILFNTEMVRANLDGRKGVTRRAIKWGDVRAVLNSPARKNTPELTDAQFIERIVSCKYEVGDILYVRENWAITSGIRDIADEGPVYMADLSETELRYLRDKNFRWKPSIHMPRDIARLFLRVTEIRAERLQNITGEGALLEGVAINPDVRPEERDCYYRALFAALWDSTTKPKELGLYGWEANPWVWVIRYERIEKPEGV